MAPKQEPGKAKIPENVAGQLVQSGVPNSALQLQQAQSQQLPQLANRNSQFSQADLNRIVLEYLNKKGYHKTESMLRIESSRIPGQLGAAVTSQNTNLVTPGSIGSRNDYDTTADTYSRGYHVLRSWCESSLDLYRADLEKFLFPIFIHCYLDLITKNYISELRFFFEKYSSDHLVLHNYEITRISGLGSLENLQSNDVAKIFRENKYKVVVSKTSLNLLLNFLHENEAIGGGVIIRIINQYIEPELSNENASFENQEREGELSLNEGIQKLDLLISSKISKDSTQQSGISQLNSKSVNLGKLPKDTDFEKEVELELKQRDENEALLNKKVDTKLVDEYAKMNENDSSLTQPSKELLPLPIKSSIDLKREIKYVQDSRSKIKLDVQQLALPSICMYTFHNTNDDMTCLNFNKDSTLIGAGFQDSFIRLWSIDGSPLKSALKNDPFNQQQYQNSRRLIGHSGSVYGIDFSPDNRYMISSSEDKTARLWSMDTYTSLVSYKGHKGPIWDVKFSPFGHYFATLSHDQTARLWSCDHINPLRIFAGHLNDVDCVEFHPNSTYVFTGSSDKTLRMWDVTRGESVRIFIGHTSAINCVSVSPDGRWLASAGEDAVVNVWDISSGRRLKTMRGHGRTSIYSLLFSQDGSVLVSGGADNSVRVWDVKRGTNDSNPEPEFFKKSVGDQTTKVDEQKKKREIVATEDHLGVYFTKKTSVYKVHFTRRNLCLVGGV